MSTNFFQNNDWSLYPYHASKAAPIVFAILLTIIGCYNIYQCFVKYHWKKFGFTMTWATLVWISGFVCRSISVYHVQAVNIFIAQFVLVLMGPPLYAVAEYFILGRLMAYLPYHAPLNPNRVISTFLFLSAVVEILTASGAANSAGSGRSRSQVSSALDCLKAALILQACIEAFFFSLVATMEYRCRRAKIFPRNVRIICYTLYITSFMMLVRCIVRAIEGFEAASCHFNTNDPTGQCAYISTHEVFLWVFEVSNICLFVIILTIFFPGRYLPRSSRIFLDPIDGKTERLGPGYAKADKRPLLVTIVDPWNLYGIATGRGMKVTQFWNEHQPIYDGQEIPSAKEEKKRARERNASISLKPLAGESGSGTSGEDGRPSV